MNGQNFLNRYIHKNENVSNLNGHANRCGKYVYFEESKMLWTMWNTPKIIDLNEP